MFAKLTALLKSGIDPKWIVVLAALVGAQKGIGQGAISLTNMVPDSWIPVIIAWNNFLAWCGVGLMGLLAALSSSVSGPLIPTISLPSIDPAKTVAKVLIAAFALSMFLAGGSAQAATKQAVPAAAPAPSKCALIFDPLKLCGVLTGNIQTDVQRVATRLAAVSKADLNYAMAKAKAVGNPASKVRLQCVQAISDAADQVNGVSLKNPDGTVMARPDPALVTAIEDVAELVDNLSPQGVLLTSCAGAAQMLGMNALQAVNAIITGSASFALLPAGL